MLAIGLLTNQSLIQLGWW